ncbi:TIR domain-containing protein [Tardiphaga robiniae]|uniref:Thoeris protein ThsB TIR-like domain-containing protein n=1 Tax=Tardiphaga robiniae TaxID=943830 RepID=A0A164AGJ7_9BRAD|nr:TIR domain-containing protein [Tardiphaga robiniae]KZD24775.1 hypothetical protein A4A58_20745 [Tardiphaga robiniae]
MAYRNGTYIAFHAGGTTDPTASDIRYYRLLKAWHEHDSIEFKFINSHDKSAAVRDSSTKETLRRSLIERLNNSRNMVLIIGPTTQYDTDWVPFEIAYAVDRCKIPIIAAYTGCVSVPRPAALSYLWPAAFASRINNRSVAALHVPFNQKALNDAITNWDIDHPPGSSLDYYSPEAHRTFGISV